MAKSTTKPSPVSAPAAPTAKKKTVNTKAAAPVASDANKAVKRRKVAFTVTAPHAHEAAVAGTFNDWQPQPLKAATEGHFSLTVMLTPGEYEYRFIVDGQWCSDASCPESVPNPYGAFNSLVRVA